MNKEQFLKQQSSDQQSDDQQNDDQIFVDESSKPQTAFKSQDNENKSVKQSGLVYMKDATHPNASYQNFFNQPSSIAVKISINNQENQSKPSLYSQEIQQDNYNRSTAKNYKDSRNRQNNRNQGRSEYNQQFNGRNPRQFKRNFDDKRNDQRNNVQYRRNDWNYQNIEQPSNYNNHQKRYQKSNRYEQDQYQPTRRQYENTNQFKSNQSNQIKHPYNQNQHHTNYNRNHNNRLQQQDQNYNRNSNKIIIPQKNRQEKHSRNFYNQNYNQQQIQRRSSDQNYQNQNMNSNNANNKIQLETNLNNKKNKIQKLNTNLGSNQSKQQGLKIKNQHKNLKNHQNGSLNRNSSNTNNNHSLMNQAQQSIKIQQSQLQRKINKSPKQQQNNSSKSSVWDSDQEIQEKENQQNERQQKQTKNQQHSFTIQINRFGQEDFMENVQNQDYSLLAILKNTDTNRQTEHRPAMNNRNQEIYNNLTIQRMNQLLLQPQVSNQSIIQHQNLFSDKQLEYLYEILQKFNQIQPKKLQLKVQSSNVQNYKIKNISSQIFCLNNIKPANLINNKFIKILQNKKQVPRDPQPHTANRQQQQQSSQIKNKILKNVAKLILAQFKNPLDLLTYERQIIDSKQQCHMKIIEKIKKNRQIFKKEVVLVCSTCAHSTKHILSDQAIQHGCNKQCANILRFQIVSMYLC